MTASCDPLAALGVRLGTPIEAEAMAEYGPGIEAAFGTEFLRLLQAALLNDDLDAAMRVTKELAPELVVEIDDDPSGVAVTYWDNGNVDGRAVITADSSGDPRVARAIIGVAIRARETYDLRRDHPTAYGR